MQQMSYKKHVAITFARSVACSKFKMLCSRYQNLSKNTLNHSIRFKSAIVTALNLLRIMAKLSPTLPFVGAGNRHSGYEDHIEGRDDDTQDKQSKRTISLLEGYFKASSKESASLHSKILTMSRLHGLMIAENIQFTSNSKVVIIIFPNIFGLTGWHTGLAKLFSSLGADVLLVKYFDRADQPNPFSLLVGNNSRTKLLEKIKTVDESTIITEIFDTLEDLDGDDKTRVYILGSSYGATLAMKLASSGDPRFRFLCLFYPSLFYRDGFTLVSGAEDLLTQFRNIIAETRIFIGEKDGVLHPINPKAFAYVSDRVVNISSFILPGVDHAYVEPYLTRILPSYLYKPWLSWLTIIYFIIFVYDDLNHSSLN